MGKVFTKNLAADPLSKTFKVEVVVVDDDVALPNLPQPRGVAGTLFVHKIAGAAAEAPPPLPELSEPEVVRHFVNLSTMNMSVDTHFYPLGSCTMKYNPKVNEWAARLPGFADLHPLVPDALAQGSLELMWTLQQQLGEIGGFPATSSVHLQREILKGEWGFQGFVVSDWGSIGELRAHGVAADLRLGGGFNERWLLYFTYQQVFFGLRDQTFAQGFTGVGATGAVFR